MTQMNPEPDTFSSEEVQAAEAVEQAALSAVQNAHLTRRVVALRAQLTRMEKTNAMLQAELQNYRSETEVPGNGEDQADVADGPEAVVGE